MASVDGKGMAAREVSGDAIASYLNYVRKSWGPSGFEECLRYAGLEGTRLRDDQRYPSVHQTRVLEFIYERQGEKGLVHAGRVVSTNIGVLKLFTKFKSLEGMIEVARERYHKTLFYGDILLEKTGDHHILATLPDPGAKKVNCIAWRGVFMGLGDLTGEKVEVTERQCRFEGADSCVFDLRW